MAPDDGTASRQEQLRLVGGALALSAHVVSGDPGQLGVQMVGRLLEGELPHLQRLRATALARLALRPLLPGLTPPVGPQIRMVSAMRDPSGQPSIVQALTVLPNGETGVVGRDDGTISAVDLETGATLWLSTGESPIASLAVSPSRGWIVAGGEDGSVRLLDPARGADLGLLGRHAREVTRVAVSPNGSRAVTLSLDGGLCVWDLDARREVGRLPGAGPFAIAPDGRSAYSVVGGALRSWDLTTLRPGPPVADDQAGILAMAVTPDGARLVTVSHLEGYAPGHPETSLNRVELTVHDLHRGRPPQSAADTEPAVGMHQFSWACATVSPDGRLAVTGSLTGRVLVWDLERLASPLVMVGHTTQVLAAAFTPDGRRLLTGGRDGTVRVWDVARRAEVPHLAQHLGEVNGVGVTPDGSRAVTVASNGSVAVWELLPRVMGRAVPCEVGPCWSLGVSPRGDRAVIGSDGVAVVLDLRTGTEIARRALPAGRSGGPVLQTGFSPDNRGIWAIDASGHRVEWEIDRDRVRAGPEPTGKSPLFGLAVTPDGACWIGGTPDGEVVTRTRGRPAAPFGTRQHRGRVRSAAISGDGRWALTGDAQGQIACWDLEQQRSTGVWQGHRSTVMALSITPDGRRAASAAFDGTLALWDLAASRRLASFTADGGLIAVALSADGRICVAGEQSGRVHALLSVAGAATPGPGTVIPEPLTAPTRPTPPDMSSARRAGQQWERELAARPGDAACAADLAIAYADLAHAHSTGDTREVLGYAVRARDLIRGLADSGASVSSSARAAGEVADALVGGAAQRLGPKFTHTPFGVESLHGSEPSGPALPSGSGPVHAVAALPDGRRVVAAGADGQLRVWDLKRREQVTVMLGHDAAVLALARTPDGSCVVSGSWDHTVRIWEPADGRAVGAPLCHVDAVFAVAITPDGRRVLSGCGDGGVREWDLGSRTVNRTWDGDGSRVMSLALAADGTQAWAGSEKGTLQQLDLLTGRSREVGRHESGVLTVAVIPPGPRVVSGSFDQTIRVWDPDHARATAVLGGHYDAVRAVVVTRDGRRAAGAFFDRTIRVFDLKWNAEVAALAGHTDAVVALALLPDGRHLVSGSNDGTVRVWDLALGGGL